MSADQPTPAFVVDWTGVDAIPPQVVNQMMTQIGMPAGSAPEGIYVTLGNVTPPVIFGSDEIQQEQVAGYGGRIKVNPVCRIVLTRARAAEMIEVLKNALNQYDEAAQTYAAAADKAHNA